MPSFLTQCPHCLTPFRVTETQLEAADGMVRCGACLGIFSATSNRITLKQTPEEAYAAAELAEPDESDEPATPEADVENPAEEICTDSQDEIQAEFVEVAAVTDTVLDSPAHERDFDVPLGDFDLDSNEDFEEDEEEEEYEDETEVDAELDEDEEFDDEDEVDADDIIAGSADTNAADEVDDRPEPPLYRSTYQRTITDKTALRQHLAELEDDEALEPLDDNTLGAFADEPVTLSTVPRRGRLHTFVLFSANLLLVAVLVLQYFYVNLDALNRSARMAPLMPYVCRILECPLVERSQLASLVSEQLLVRSHPGYAQALEVSFIFRNDALEAQPFPALELSFNDTSNQLLANRLFKPADYLPGELQTSEMSAQSSLQITLELVDPGSEAVNYTLAFRAP